MSNGSSPAVINVTPMIDVLLVLLIIFMVITPLQPVGLDTRVPQPSKDSFSNGPSNNLVIQVKGGSIGLDQPAASGGGPAR